MLPNVIEARHHHDFVVWLKFNDGKEGFVDLEPELFGPVFEPLRDPKFFERLRVNRDIGTIDWENGADFAPEFLYDEVCKTRPVETRAD